DVLRAGQGVFERTGGLHAAGLFTADGSLLCLREDIGRHNALDKVAGRRLLDGKLPASDSVLVVSGRAGYEIVQKSIAAGIPVLAAVGAPSSLAAWGGPAERLGLGTSRLGLRLVGGIALAAVLLLPAAARVSAVPILPGALAIAAVVVSIGEEVAFRGALFAALEDVGGAPVAVVGSTLAWTAAHALSHPAEFLPAVAAAGLLLAMWRLVFRDLV